MYKEILKIMIVGIALVFMSACSKKTTAQNTGTSQSPPPNQENSQKGQRQGKGGPPQFSELLSKMDANKDAMLSMTEVKGRLKNDFTKVDTNKDGFITEEEFKNAPRPARRGKN